MTRTLSKTKENTVNKNDILAELNRTLPDGRSATFTAPPERRHHEAHPLGIIGKANMSVISSLVHLIPGEWIKIGPYHYQGAQSAVQQLRGYGLRTATRRNDDGYTDIYVRYSIEP